MQSDPRGRLTDFTAKRIASPGVRERPIGLTDRTPTASQIGLTDQPLTSASQIGLSRPPTRPHRSQIGLSDRSDYVTDLTDSFHSYLDRSDVP